MFRRVLKSKPGIVEVASLFRNDDGFVGARTAGESSPRGPSFQEGRPTKHIFASLAFLCELCVLIFTQPRKPLGIGDILHHGFGHLTAYFVRLFRESLSVHEAGSA